MNLALRITGALVLFFGATMASTVDAERKTREVPIQWRPPESFDPDAKGLGLPRLDGVEHTLLYDPKPSACNLDEGGSGRYESLRHGTYSHHPEIVLFEDKFIVHWTQHSADENGPGQRVLAKVGTFNADRNDIEWGGDETLVELAPAPVPVRRKKKEHDPDLIYETFAGYPELQIIDDKLYLTGRLSSCHGWVNDVKYHGGMTEPIPAEHWSDRPGNGFRYDVWWDMGCQYVQQWGLEDGELVATSQLFKRSEPVEQVEVTRGRFKKAVDLLEPYANAKPFAEAPRTMREDVLRGEPQPSNHRVPNYAPGTWKLTRDGTDGLAHHAEFRRPDGTWVVIRDNLENPGHYYAAEKGGKDEVYPPAVRTNLFGHAMPVAGELPDGRPWIVCNDRSRRHMYLVLSDDGYTFDRSWLLMHNPRKPSDDGLHKGGGPQYFQAVTVGENIWVVYSITKEQIGVTRIPFTTLPKPSAETSTR